MQQRKKLKTFQIFFLLRNVWERESVKIWSPEHYWHLKSADLNQFVMLILEKRHQIAMRKVLTSAKEAGLFSKNLLQCSKIFF